MKQKKNTNAGPLGATRVGNRFLTLGMDNPLIQIALVAAFIGGLYYLSMMTRKDVQLPEVGELAGRNILAKKPVSCRQPNPRLDPQRLAARKTAKAVYAWERPNSAVVKNNLREAFNNLGSAMQAAATLEREISLLRRRGAQAPTEQQPLVKVSEFYKGPAKQVAPPREEPLDEEVLGKQVEQMHKDLVQLKVNAWTALIDRLSFSRLGLDDRECLRALSDPSVREQVLLAVVEILDRTHVWLILDAFEPRFPSDRQNGIILKASGQLLPPDANVFTYVEAIDQIHASLADSVMAGRFGTLANSQLLRNLVKNIVAGQIRPNFHRDDEATRLSMEAAEASVPLTMPIAFATEEIIIPMGSRVASWQVACLRQASIGEDSSQEDQGLTLIGILEHLGRLLLTASFVLMPFFFLRRVNPHLNLHKRDLSLSAVLLLIQSSVLYLYSILAEPLQTSFGNLREATIFVAAPITLAPMIVRIMIGSELALVVAVTGAMISGLVLMELGIPDLDGEFVSYYMIYSLLSGMVAIIASKKVSRRLALAGAGVTVGISGLVYWLMVYFSLLENSSQGQLQLLFASLLSGVLTYIFAIALIPSFEGIFGYLTDMKLMEYVNLNHPAMKELYEKARGTYDHSATVSKLAEVASQTIGANTLLAKAGSYFHDLGKLSAKEVPSGATRTDMQDRGIGSPQYFVENQTEGTNPHDHLSPAMSARILRRHVEKSVEEIRKHRLGKEIQDIAAQHHGTTVMQFFYNRALELAPDQSMINEDDFRYPGPKPQTKEAGIVMLADSVEAAVRTLKDHSEWRIRGKVEHIINGKIEDKQLDECPLTFQDLGKIRESFVEVLVSIYHGRISYPEMKRKDQSTVRIRRTHQNFKELRAEIEKEENKTDETRKSDLDQKRTTNTQTRPDEPK